LSTIGSSREPLARLPATEDCRDSVAVLLMPSSGATFAVGPAVAIVRGENIHVVLVLM